MEDNKEYPEHIAEVIKGLKEVREKVQDLAYTLILDGDAKYMVSNNIGESYPFNPADYFDHDSLDPQVVALAGLMDKVDETIRVIKCS